MNGAAHLSSNFVALVLAGTLLAPTDAEAGKPIGGAWGQSLGARFDRFGEGAAGQDEEESWFEFDAHTAAPILKRFMVLTTPIGYRIFGILAEDSLGDQATCSKWAGGLFGTFAKTYQGDQPPTELHVTPARDGFDLVQPTIGRRISIACSVKGELAVLYEDEALRQQAAVEARELAALATRFRAGDVAAVLPRLLELAASGQAQAEYLTGLAYARGDSVARDEDQAMTLYRRAAAKGLIKAYMGLGRLEMNRGHGDEALAWTLKAAQAGLPAAQYNACLMYSGGGNGISVDEVQAWRWCDAAATAGHSKAARERDITESRLTPAQLASARQQSESWLARHHKP